MQGQLLYVKLVIRSLKANSIPDFVFSFGLFNHIIKGDKEVLNLISLLIYVKVRTMNFNS